MKLRIDSLWDEIVKARQLLESSRNGIIGRMTEATEKNIEETIEKMLEIRKKLISEYNSPDSAIEP